MKKTRAPENLKAFFTELLNKSAGNYDLFSDITPGYDVAIAKGKFRISGVVLKYWKKGIGDAVGLIIQNKDYSLNKDLYEYLFILKNQVETEFGEPLAWSGYKNPKRFWIRKWFTIGALNLPETWGPLQDGMIDAMKKFDEIFSPRIAEFRQRIGR